MNKNQKIKKYIWQRRPLLSILILILLFVVIFPFLWIFQMSLRPVDDAMGYDLFYIPTFEHYISLWTDDSEFPKSFLNSVYSSLLATIISLVAGIPAAYSLSRWDYKNKNQINLWILATRMAPPIAFTIPFFLAYRTLGLVDTILGLSLIYITFNLK